MTKLTLGPLQYYWPRQTVLDFYDEVCTWPVDTVYLGEVVCSRRHELRAQDWIDLADRVAGAGKEVVLSSLALLESEADLRLLRRLAGNGRFLIEANDMSAVHVAAQAGVPFVIGPHVNVYNPATLAALHGCGARRWVAPIETPRSLLVQMLAARPADMQCEVLVYGRLPLAFSARCFTARAHNLSKDDCRYRCLDDPDGLTARTQEGQPLLVINGIQTQSASIYNLLPAVADLQALGVQMLRLSPASRGTAEVVCLFRACVGGEVRWQEAYARLPQAEGAGYCDGYWHDRPGLEHVFAGCVR